MDPTQFDQFARSLGQPSSRRTALGGLTGILLTFAGEALPGSAKRRRHKHHKRRGSTSACIPGWTQCGLLCTDMKLDPMNCGRCGNVCTAPAHASAPACRKGNCTFSCDAGFGDCNGDPSDGCETTLGSGAHCSACADTCVSTQTCQDRVCTCPGAAPDLCGGQCTNVQADPNNCGRCGHACNPTQICSGGSCGCADGQRSCGDGTCSALFGCCSDAECNNGDACALHACVDHVCSSTPVVCDDGNLCTTNGCNSNSGCIFTAVSCDDGDPCTVDTCDPAVGCVHTLIPGC